MLIEVTDMPKKLGYKESIDNLNIEEAKVLIEELILKRNNGKNRMSKM